jgi:hypothetical protein
MRQQRAAVLPILGERREAIERLQYGEVSKSVRRLMLLFAGTLVVLKGQEWPGLTCMGLSGDRI